MSLKHGDLRGTVLPDISIDEFEPKSGKDSDVVVVAFYLIDEPPAKDLNTFIQRGFIDTLDVEVSPNTDEDGRYLVFVEFKRDTSFFGKFKKLLKDIENLTGPEEWKIRTYFSNEKSFSIDDPMLQQYIIIDPASYVPKEEFNMKNIKENVENFFKDSLLTHLTIEGNLLTMSNNRHKITAELVDIGDYDTVIGRNFLGESAFNMYDKSHEAKVLLNMIGDYQLLPISTFLCINKGDDVLLLRNTQLNYGA